MEKLGVWLRQTRQAKGSTLEEAEATTRIRFRFLNALEEGDYAAFPGGEVQIRGFLRIYARYLGLPADEVLARYHAEVRSVKTDAPVASAEARPTPSSQPPARAMTYQPRDVPLSSPRSAWMNPETLMVIGVVLIILLAILTVVGILMSRNGAPEASPTATAVSTTPAEIGLPPPITSSITTSITPSSSPLPAVTPTFPVSSEGGVTLTLEATEHAWARVTRDGRQVFQGTMVPEQPRTWTGERVISVETGNGAGLLVTVNGQSQGRMCGRGQVCARAWGPDGEITAP